MTQGTGAVVGSLALVEQRPWIMSGTLRDNILFGRDYDEGFYNKVIHACALFEDINNWANKDLTKIGERGFNISGGQKARLALARAVYSRADIYVLDDPLSAVDAHVMRHILDHVIMDSGLLAALRPKLGIIPQEPTMFKGPFRQNLDPLVEHNIEDMWSSIIKCGVVKKVQPQRSNRFGSEDEDEDDSDSFSEGQQQLFGLCRLLMRNRKIIVLDEATANVDLETDRQVHSLIQSEFKVCTVLTIAHRLETIMRSDRVIVMDSGKIVEVGPPAELLANNGHFAELVKANDFGQ
ncbi:hypothetical protein IWW48_004359 [Coemansia sp. RSA 1200]|nr:hypothetical protein IWW48_004359 [Coemansia sp. RSA 1200]